MLWISWWLLFSDCVSCFCWVFIILISLGILIVLVGVFVVGNRLN